jgi:hypothetical protein
MNMPGFSAETSLYETNVQYHAANQHEQVLSGIVTQFTIVTPFSPSLPTSASRPVSPWHKYVFEPFCRVKRQQFLDLYTGQWIELCVKVCSDGSAMPIPCED